MRNVLRLAFLSLLNRKVTTSLTILSIALSVALLIGVERVRSGARESFSQTISQTDLIVGARGGDISLLLYSVFHMGNPTNNIAIESYSHFAEHPAIKWTIPISLGDSHKGFRVLATTKAFFDHYRYQRDKSLEISEGRWNDTLFDVVIGSDVAKRLGYKLGDPIVIAHGITSGATLFEHSQTPFRIKGILERTTTPIDRGLYISLEAMEAIHVGWQTGAPPRNADFAPELTSENLKPKQITAFFAAAHARTDALRVLREVNEFADEPLLAIVPAIALGELWRSLSYAEMSLKIVASIVVAVSVLGMLIALYTTLNERRREISILRAVGSSKWLTISLFTAETFFLTAVGTVLGLAGLYSALFVSQSMIQNRFGVYIPIQWLDGSDIAIVLSILALGTFSGVVIGIQAHRNSLADGLTIRV